MSMNGPVEGHERNLKEWDFVLLWAGAAIAAQTQPIPGGQGRRQAQNQRSG